MPILQGDCRAVLQTLPAGSVHCCVTSPPYFGLRDYGVAGQIGLEPTPDEYVEELVSVFREVRRVLRGDGTLWLNLGDSYAANGSSGLNVSKPSAAFHGGRNDTRERRAKSVPTGLKPKDLIGIPWRVAFALQADGWYLRSDIIWHKPNPMPESVTDRPTSAHEHVFLLSKSERYFYDADAIKEPTVDVRSIGRRTAVNGLGSGELANGARFGGGETGRNARNVWTISTKPFKGAHFATFPPDLAEKCILAGSPVGGTILDPFGGAGTTGLVAGRHGRESIMIELNPAYAAIAGERLRVDAPLLEMSA